tara:strand:+ start:450 stop:1778 length:1329 start_codon:yes stop_codon:yes gene_type:complete
MPHKKKILAVHLNEFNYKFLKYGAKKYNCHYINEILKFNKIKTYSLDREQDKNLDPWVQSVSINTGKKSKKHKIFNTGQKVPNKLIQIWDYLAKKNLKCAVWSTMNAKYKKNKNIEIFFPDPWNNQTVVKPKELKNLYELPRNYAQNYTDFSFFKNFTYILKFFISCVNFGVITYFIRKIFLYTKIFVKTGFKNYFLFFLFDIISLKAFYNITENKKLNFSLIFLNSLAHFQHNNWDEKENFYKYFLLTDEICKNIIKLGKNYDEVIIYNGFTQKKIRPEYIIRPTNPKEFIKSTGVKFDHFHSNMTNGGIIIFKNNIQKKKSLKILKEYNVFGFKVFEVKKLNSNNIFIRIQIKSFYNFNTDTNSLNNKKIVRELSYEKNNLKLTKKNINKDFYFFKSQMTFIKTTGKHTFEGELLFKNNLIKKKKIENRNIFLVIKNFFK